METTEFFKSKAFKFLLPFVILLSIITIARAGYDFGQWFFDKIH